MVDLVLVSSELQDGEASAGVVSYADGAAPAAYVQACLPDGAHWVGGRLGRGGERASSGGGRLLEHPVVFTQPEVAGFLAGFTRSTLEPLSDDRPGRMQVRRGWWETYRTVNERFANVAAASAPPNAIVAVHGLELLLVPAALRRKRPDVRIIVRLPAPFPAQDRLALLPWRRELMEGVLGADAIVVPSPMDASHVAHAAAFADAWCDDGVHVRADDREATIVMSPVQVDAAGWAGAAPTVVDAADRPRTLLLGVDRADHASGVVQRVRAFGELLEEGMFDPAEVGLVELSLPSRSRVADDGVRQAVLDHVARINRQHGSTGCAAPIEWYDGPFSSAQVAQWFGRADVLVVNSLTRRSSPLALEYVAGRREAGSVVLSEFSSTQLPGAVIAHPFDIEDVKRALLDAVAMSPDERGATWAQMRGEVAGHDHRAWLEAGIASLELGRDGELLTDA